MVKGLVRTVKDALEFSIGTGVPPDHPLMTWIVQYVSTMYRRCARGSDGRTPMERATGKKNKALTAEFGGKIHRIPR